MQLHTTSRLHVRSITLALSLAILSPAAAQAPAGEAAPKATEAPAAPAVVLPPAAEIVAKSIVARGGKEAWLKRTSMTAKGTMEIPAAGLKGSMTTVWVAPNKMAVMLELPGLGRIRSGHDGTHGWTIEPTGGPRLVSGGEKETLARESDWMRDFELDRHWDSLVTVGEGEFAGVACWKVEAKKDDRQAMLWFEKESGLPRGTETTAETQLGKIPVVTSILEYGTFDGLKVATRSETKQMGQKMVMAVESVVFDAATPSDVELPAEVKALLEPEPTEDEDGEAESDESSPGAAPAAPAAPAVPTTPAAPKG